MRYASSILKGGNLIDALEGDYSKQRGLLTICPFCRETVFWVKEHIRYRGNNQGVIHVKAAWKHYKQSVNTQYCENRALTKEGKDTLKKLQTKARNQRLRLFNRRFWDIFMYQKPRHPNVHKTAEKYLDLDNFKTLMPKVQNAWDVEVIISKLPAMINETLKDVDGFEEALRSEPHVNVQLSETDIQYLIYGFNNTKIDVVRYKILTEVVEWLKTSTALPSFEKLIIFSLIEAHEVTKSFPTLNDVLRMAVIALTLTDWEKAIEALPNPTKGLGFM